jgi:hypothetical protein
MFTKYKLQKLKTKQILHQTILKLQNSHSKIHNSAGTSSVKPKDSRNSGGASSPRAPPLAAREPTRRREQGRKTGGSGSASFPFPFSAGGDNHRHLQ